MVWVLGEVLVKVVKHFCYLSDMLDSWGCAERAIRARVGAAGRKWNEISNLLGNGCSTTPACLGIRALHKICYAL